MGFRHRRLNDGNRGFKVRKLDNRRRTFEFGVASVAKILDTVQMITAMTAGSTDWQ